MRDVYSIYLTEGPFVRDAIEKAAEGQFIDGNTAHLLWRSDETFNEIFDSIKSAGRFICLEFYIFRDDETGRELARLLKQKVAEGVKVYLLYDHFGSFGNHRGFWKEMQKTGIRLQASHPFKWVSPMHYIHRDHRKLIIIDGQIAFTGGLNIANEYRGYRRRSKMGWRDTGIVLRGPVVSLLTSIFSRTWQIWGGEPIKATQTAESFSDGLPVMPIFADSSRGRRRLRKILYYSIDNAQESILLTTAYFVPSKRMIYALEMAVNRAVKVKLLLPGRSDIMAADYAGRAFFKRLLRVGVQIFTYQGEILHAKTAVFDRCWSIVGSANLDFQSLRRNDEGNVGILDSGFGKKMADIFDGDLKHSIEIKEEDWRRRPVCEKLKERFFVIFRRRL